ncbi:MAG: hypothetical protein ACKVUS_00630 [Saprospiraceae bacterium]
MKGTGTTISVPVWRSTVCSGGFSRRTPGYVNEVYAFASGS